MLLSLKQHQEKKQYRLFALVLLVKQTVQLFILLLYILADQACYVHVYYAAIENFFLICCWHQVLSLSNLKPQNVIQG
jgi:hypothetical protein